MTERKTVYITGSTGTFGQALVSFFLNRGDTVIAHGRCPKKLNKLYENMIIKFSESNKLFLSCFDLMDESASLSIVADLLDRDLSVTHLVNNARSSSYLETTRQGFVSRKNFQCEFTLDVIVPYELTFAFANSNHKLKSVVNIGSQYGLVAVNPNLYGDQDYQSPIHY